MTRAGTGSHPWGHVSVLLDEVIALLAPRPGGVYIDGTFGVGGYTEAILSIGGTRVYGIDRDPSAIALGERRFFPHFEGRLTLLEGCFSKMRALVGSLEERVDGVVLDLGVCSRHLDTPERGFSFVHEGPLDMRMGGEGITASEVVNTFSEEELADIFWNLGEERKARAIARAVVRRRVERPFHTTRDLALCVEAMPGGSFFQKRKGRHPATLIFQALRIFVNRELEELHEGLEEAAAFLAPQGRLVVVSFHSLEDRIVKTFFAEKSGKKANPSRFLPFVEGPKPSFVDVCPKGMVASSVELLENPRARSARVRAIAYVGDLP